MSQATLNQPATEAGIWRVDPAHSQVEFGVRHMMISTVKGTFAGVEGELTVPDAGLAEASVAVRIDASTIDTRNPDRDAHLRSEDFFWVDAHPDISFRSTRVEVRGEELRVHGLLEIRGTARPVVLEAERLGGGTDPWGQERIAFNAGTRIHRKDFGLTWNQALETGGVLVADEVRVSLDVQLVKQAAEVA